MSLGLGLGLEAQSLDLENLTLLLNLARSATDKKAQQKDIKLA